eukprot:5370754-Pyramimonas_sp.AAC.1
MDPFIWPREFPGAPCTRSAEGSPWLRCRGGRVSGGGGESGAGQVDPQTGDEIYRRLTETNADTQARACSRV